MTDLQRIEKKLDQLLALIGARHVTTEEDQLATVFATQGIKGLKTYFENMPAKEKRK